VAKVRLSGNEYAAQATHQVLATLAEPYSLAVTTTSAVLTVASCTGRISLVAQGVPIAIVVTGADGDAPVAVAGTSHLIKEDERIDIRVPESFRLAAVADSGTSGTLRVSVLG